MATILIVDDEEPLREFLAQFLTELGHRTVQAIHGAHALEIVNTMQPDLVISDVMMPILGGAELCRQLKSTSNARVIPVILMSAAGGRGAEGTGADAFINKPFELDDVEALVRRLSG